MTDSGKLNLERVSSDIDASRGRTALRSGTSPTLISRDCFQQEAAVGPSSNATRMPWQRKLRGSCDFCARRKKKCDGNGITRCSLCMAKNQLVCHYSEC
ncbi:unnamed protein product, partial [Ascophyllum nodosum]